MSSGSVDRASRLVEQLLTLARNEPRAPGEESTDIALDTAAPGIADGVALAEARGIEVRLDAPPGCRVRGDRDGLRMLVRNLVDNAMRYTPTGGRVEYACVRLAIDRAASHRFGPGYPRRPSATASSTASIGEPAHLRAAADSGWPSCGPLPSAMGRGLNSGMHRAGAWRSA